MTRSHRLRSLLLVAALCVVLGVGGVAVVDGSEHRSDNETRHEHPDEVGDDGDLAAVQEWLGDRMTEVHVDCAENLSAGESVACDRLDEEYPEYLERYASVERERTGDNETARAYENAGEDQRELANETREYRETYQEYQQARAAGDEERSRRLARELTERADRIEELGGSLNSNYTRIESRTGRDYDDAQRSTNRTVSEVRRTTLEVQQAEFTPTNLTASFDDRTASFRDPAEVSGRLTDENGTALSGRDLAVVADNRTVTTVRTGSDGTYEATYRPVTTTTGPTSVDVSYQPTGTDPYLGANASADVDVESVAASLFVDVGRDRVAFGDAVPVTANVTVLGTDAEGVPVAMYLGDERVASGRTAANGSVRLSGTVPATVRDGERTLSVRASRDGTALDPAVENETVTVEETATDLSLEGRLDGEDLVLTGQLTANGRPVPNQRVGVNVDGEVRRMAATDGDGRYRVRVPRETGGRGIWSVTADYDAPRTNLGPATTTQVMRAGDLEATSGTERNVGLLGRLRQVAALVPFIGSLSDVELLALAGGLFVGGAALAGAVGLAVRRRLADGEADAGTADEEPIPAFVDASDADDANGAPTDGATEAASSTAVEGVEALDVARDRLGEGATNDAVKIGYGAVRRQLADASADGADDARTHWEFYRDVAGELSDDRADALERLTIAYQRAEFAPETTGRDTARAALHAAEACLSPSADGRPKDVA